MRDITFFIYGSIITILAMPVWNFSIFVYYLLYCPVVFLIYLMISKYYDKQNSKSQDKTHN